MGELIKKEGILRLGKLSFDVELNKPETIEGDKLIHIQNKFFRFDCSEREFLELGTAILNARENLIYYKKRDSNTD